MNNSRALLRPKLTSFNFSLSLLLACSFTALTVHAELASDERQITPVSTQICRESLSSTAQVRLTLEMDGILRAHLYHKATLALRKSFNATNGQFTNNYQPQALKDIVDFIFLQNHSRKPFDGHKSVRHLAGMSWFSTSPELRQSLKSTAAIRNQEDLFVEMFIDELLPKIRNPLQIEALNAELYRIRDSIDHHLLHVFLPPPGGVYRLDSFAELFNSIADIETPEQLARYKESRWLYANMPTLSWKALDRYVITGELINPLADFHWMDEHPLLGGTGVTDFDPMVIAQAASVSPSQKEVIPLLAQLRHNYDEFRKAKYGLQQTLNRLTGLLASESETLERRRSAHVKFETQLMTVIATMAYGPSRSTWTMPDLVDLFRSVPGQIEFTTDAIRLNPNRRAELALLIQLLQSYTKTAALMQLTQSGRNFLREDLEVLRYEDFVGRDALGRLIGLFANLRLGTPAKIAATSP